VRRPKNLRETVKGPEAIIQAALVKYLNIRDWNVMETHGNLYQRGFPDLYCTHEKHKQRWIEVKNPDAYSFTNSQIEFFPLISKGCNGIWILTAATDEEYQKLWEPPNWWKYLK
jgi:hypothetical protein